MNWLGKTPLAIIIILFTSFGVYFNTLSNGFVYDDTFIVVENPWIRDVKYLPDIFSKGLWEFQGESASGFYRPLVHAMYMVTYSVFGLKPWGFHLVNVLLHAGVSVLVFLVAAGLLRRGVSSGEWFSTPLFAGVLFATHPIHTEVVAWVAGVMDLLFTLFFLLSLHFYLRWKEKGGRALYCYSVLSFFLSTLCKEPALVLPAVLVVYDYVFDREPSKSRHHKIYIPYGAVVALYLIFRLHADVGIVSTESRLRFTFIQLLLNILVLFVQYLWKLLLPINLNVYYAFRPVMSPFSGNAVFAIIFAVGFIGLFVAAWNRNKEILFLLCLVTLSLLPVLYFPAVHNPIADRYLYLPSVGFVMILSYSAAWLVAKSGKMAKVGIVTVIVITILLYSVGTVERNRVWKNEYSLWSDAAKKSPDKAIPHHNLGKALESMGRLDEAMDQYRIGLSLPSAPPINSMAHNNLGFAYKLKGDLEMAIAHYVTAVGLQPTETRARTNLAAAYMETGLLEEAIEQLRIVVQLRPGDSTAHYNLGVAYEMKGFPEEALTEFDTAETLAPGDSELRAVLERKKGAR